jgi:broad specificity phosphatase PhoE
LSNIYLVRHGQAGTRDAYDSLSELGQRQSRLLGEYFISQGIEFSVAYAGTMERQQQTAEEVKAAYIRASKSFPEIIVDSNWCEFDLTRVYREIGPALAEVDPEFRRGFEEMRLEIREHAESPEAEVHRRWRPCDTKIVETWIACRFPYTAETWEQFCQRVAGCCENLRNAARHSNILVFTSATPTAVLTSLALGITDGGIRRLAGVLYNSSYTVLRQRDELLSLFQFNAVPHLTKPELRTHR